jgi:hypothetical protein
MVSGKLSLSFDMLLIAQRSPFPILTYFRYFPTAKEDEAYQDHTYVVQKVDGFEKKILQERYGGVGLLLYKLYIVIWEFTCFVAWEGAKRGLQIHAFRTSSSVLTECDPKT